LKKLSLAVILLLFTLLLAFTHPAIADTLDSNGAKIFENNCAGCHVNGGNIIRRGKNLKLKALRKNNMNSVDAIALIVANGKNNMSAYQDRLTPQEIQAVSTYVLQQAENNWK
jgi:cytochrome c6